MSMDGVSLTCMNIYIYFLLMELFLCTLYTVRGSNKQGNVIRVNKMNCCIYCTHVCLNVSETSLKTSYSKLRSVEPDKHFPNYRPCRVFIKYFHIRVWLATLCLYSRLQLIKFTSRLRSHLRLPLSLIWMAISSAPWLTNNVRARNSIFCS